MSHPVFVLASASPTRKKILENAGFTPIVRVSYFDEDAIQVSDPTALVLTLAQCKAKAILPDLSQELGKQNTLVMGCDSIMYLNGMIYGKPDTKEIAIATWQKMRGNYCELYTGHCLIDIQNQRTVMRHGVTKVYFAEATDAEIESYVDSGEPLCCAGCFTLEKLGGLLIDKIEGCHTNVLGLSLPILRQMLAELGYSIQFSANGTTIK
ncbi:MAG: nucleoside triphosphate pyrophosphatase [Pseudanabaena sp.]|jgi:septum formation protein|nr:septum formation inhibitor Maf [Pseudanabaena sp. M53BS1SP1A06MG]MCA6580752.1 septum formation inhibitor Maf [Pseudanabaena sp. M34BS1SP1A06MG]MCA6586350.1 septum formation inhibitor Maf [Pseudanabaena sp. M051S1SP1A06QC]MCA6587789.1 septum formation inhibitor Maf [Pseudanabaena sp. M109S1SP1A06QC]MCA6591613.1 septum formation inhibitor Maf [Pseudanabaena sp. M38BS1SP1A06MG]MCA6595769.1 septum formation inhibitor Maf [Pseudanabaena sp. M046S1SP1A06QC]MCA6599856.1 septum formation inhibitor